MLLRKWFAIACVMVLVAASSGFGQVGNGRGNRNQPGQAGGRGGLPSVSDLVKRFDKNRDGKLTKSEVTEPPFNQNFGRWDVNRDGIATGAEIAKFRRALGIPVQGTAGAPNRPLPPDDNDVVKLTIPDVDGLRVGPGTRLDLKLLQPRTRANYEKSRRPAPCFLHYRSGDRELVFLGTKHGTNVNSSSHRLIEELILKFKPDCVVLESVQTKLGISPRQFLTGAQRAVASGACHEAGFAAVLAARHKIDFIGGEPPGSATTAALRELGNERDTLGWLVARGLTQVLREKGPAQLDNGISQLLPNLKRRFELNIPMDVADFKTWFRARMNRPFSAESMRTVRMNPFASPEATFIEKGAVAVMLARETHLLSLQARLLSKYRRVLVIYGVGHLPYEEPVLEGMMGEPVRMDTRW